MSAYNKEITLPNTSATIPTAITENANLYVNDNSELRVKDSIGLDKQVYLLNTSRQLGGQIIFNDFFQASSTPVYNYFRVSNATYVVRSSLVSSDHYGIWNITSTTSTTISQALWGANTITQFLLNPFCFQTSVYIYNHPTATGLIGFSQQNTGIQTSNLGFYTTGDFIYRGAYLDSTFTNPITLTHSNWYTFRIETDGSGVTRFTILDDDGNMLFSENLSHATPTGSLVPWVGFYSGTGVALTNIVGVDYVLFAKQNDFWSFLGGR